MFVTWVSVPVKELIVPGACMLYVLDVHVLVLTYSP